jgi:enoyl-CoA hydratase/carnithine racemase
MLNPNTEIAMSEPALLYEKRDDIAYITFNRPQVSNAVDPEAFYRLQSR